MPLRLQSSSVLQHWAKTRDNVIHAVRISKCLILDSKRRGSRMNAHVVDH